jgi:hypothetical protein
MTVRLEKETLIGKRIPKLDAPKKVTGEAQYLHDLELPGMLAAKILRCDRVHARIVSVDTSAARALPGVKAVLTAADTPGVPLGHGKDNPPLKGDKVRCIRDEIAAVAAESEAIAEAALGLIKVEYEDLPAVFSPADALAPGAPVIHEAHPNNIPFTWDYRRRQRRHRSIRFRGEPDRLLVDAGSFPVQEGDRADCRRAAGEDPRDSAGHRRRVRKQAGHLSLRAHLHPAGQGDPAAGSPGVLAAGGVHCLAHAAAGGADLAERGQV